MVPSPLAFLEMKEELINANTAQLCHAKFGIGPEAFDAIDMILASSEFVFVMVNTMMLESAGHQSIVGFPSVGVNVALFQDAPLENGHEFSFGAVGHHAHEDTISALVKAENRSFSTGPTSSFPSDSSGSKVAFIHLDLSRKGLQIHQSQFHHSIS